MHLCVHAEQYTVHLYAEQLYPCACLGYWAITTIYFYTDASYGDGVTYLCAVSVIYEERPQLNRMILLGGIPGAVYTLLVLSNFFYKMSV